MLKLVRQRNRRKIDYLLKATLIFLLTRDQLEYKDIRKKSLFDTFHSKRFSMEQKAENLALFNFRVVS